MSSWRSFLQRIGEKCPEYDSSLDFKEHIEICFSLLRRQLEHSQDDVLDFLFQCSEQFPQKIPFYGTLTGLLNLENEDFALKVVQKVQSNFQDALDIEDSNKIRVLMRLLVVMMCSKVIQPISIVTLFESLLSSATLTIDEEKGNPAWQARGDFYVTCILSCLPWGGLELVEQAPEGIERIMLGVEAYMNIRRNYFDGNLSIFDDDESTNGAVGKNFLEDLWCRIQILSNNGWKLDSVPRLHLPFEAQLVAGTAHPFDPINMPSLPEPLPQLCTVNFWRQKHISDSKYPKRMHRLHIFPTTKVELDMTPIDRFMIEDYLLDVLFSFNGRRKECAPSLIAFSVPFRYEYLLAETIFSQLLLLPHPPFKPVYYGQVIVDLCKALPGAFPSVVAAAAHVLFDRISNLDMDCRTRLVLWFAHHLSNFQFSWPWEEWTYVLNLPKWAPKHTFVREVLERESRLSYWERIKQSIENAPALEAMLPPKGGPNFRYFIEDDDKEKTEEHALSAELIMKVKGRQTVRELVSWLEDSVFPNHAREVVLKVVVQTLLDVGSKSFTHLVTILERYGQLITQLCPDEEKQVMLIDEVSFYWKYNVQMTAIAIDRMMGYRLVSNLAIVRWVFSSENLEQFHTCDRPWEVLRNAINKTYYRISDLRKEILSLKKSVVSAEEAVEVANSEVDTAESKLSLVNGEPVVGGSPMRLKRLKARAQNVKEVAVSVRDSLEAKEAVLARAVDENEALFLSLYKNFSIVLTERLADFPMARTLRELKPRDTKDRAVDLEEPSSMEVDTDCEEEPKRGQSDDGHNKEGYNVEEKLQWCLTTLAYVKSFSRQYASEIWTMIDRLNAEVFTEHVHPLLLEAFSIGLQLNQ